MRFKGLQASLIREINMTTARIRRITIAALEITCLAAWLVVLFALTIWTP